MGSILAPFFSGQASSTYLFVVAVSTTCRLLVTGGDAAEVSLVS